MSSAPAPKPVRPGPAAPGHASGPRPAPHTYPTDQDTHILDRLAIIYRYRRIAAVVFALTASAFIIQGYSNIKVYQAQARVLIEDERSTAMPGITSTLDTYWQDPLPYYQTQYRILKGRDLIRRVVRKLDLQNVPEFNGTAAPPVTPISMLKDAARGLTGLWQAPEPVVEEAPRVDETADEAQLVNAFIGRVVVAPVTDSKLVDVMFQSSDPVFAARATNALVDEYVEQNLAVKLQSTENMLEWLANELGVQQAKMESSERALAEYRDHKDAMSLDDRNNIVLSQLNTLNDSLLRARTNRIEKEVLFKQVQDLSGAERPDAIPVVAQNVQIQALKRQLTDLQQQKAQLMERYTDRHPEVQKINAQLADTNRQIEAESARTLQTVKADYDRAALEERTLAANLERAKADVKDLSRLSVDYNVMEREAESNRTVYNALLQRERELRVSANSRLNNVRVIERAEIPGGPVSPAGRTTWLLAIAIGLAAAAGVAYGLDYMNDTIKTPEDITRQLKLTFLGLVPAVRGDRHPVLASSHTPHDFGEAFRSLRTSLITRYPGEGAKTMVVTSAQPLEGKTTTAANIAMALAYGGSRVLLIDADMRRPGLHRPLRLNNDRGLSQILTGQARVRDVIQRTVDPNLLAVTAGRTPPNPSELLSSERMKTLVTNLAHGPFDWIIIDTPPVLAVTDAVILAPVVSGVTFVVGSEMTRRRLAERALETIMASHPKMIGVVLNRVDFARNKYYYHRYYGYEHKNYYAEAV